MDAEFYTVAVLGRGKFASVDLLSKGGKKHTKARLLLGSLAGKEHLVELFAPKSLLGNPHCLPKYGTSEGAHRPTGGPPGSGICGTSIGQTCDQGCNQDGADRLNLPIQPGCPVGVQAQPPDLIEARMLVPHSLETFRPS